MKFFVYALAPVLLLLSCQTREFGDAENAAGEFVRPDQSLEEIRKLLANNKIAPRDLGKLQTNQGKLNFHNAFVGAWLSGIAYGSASQILQELELAGIADPSSAAKARQELSAIESFKTLSESLAGPSSLKVFEYKNASTVQQKNNIAFEKLPKAYFLLLKNAAFATSLDSSLRNKLTNNPILSRQLTTQQVDLVFSLFASKNPVEFGKSQKAWSANSTQLEYVFDALILLAVEHCESQFAKLLARGDELAGILNKFGGAAGIANFPAQKKLALYSDTLEYEFSHNFSNTGKGSDQKIFFFSGGKIQTSQKNLFQSGSTQLIVIEHQNNQDVFFVFRGTSGFKDISVDLNADVVSDPLGSGGQIHKGFYDAFQELALPKASAFRQQNQSFRPFLSEVLMRAEKSKKRIWIVGHSLGGALAILFADQLLSSKVSAPLVAGVITAGAPMVGDKTFAAALDSKMSSDLGKVLRFRYEHDLISTINPNAVLNPKKALSPDSLTVLLSLDGRCGLFHSKDMSNLSNHSTALGESAKACSGESFAAFDKTLSPPKDNIERILDHNITNYLSSLAKLRKKSP